MRILLLTLISSCFLLVACDKQAPPETHVTQSQQLTEIKEEVSEAVPVNDEKTLTALDIDTVLTQQDVTTKARFGWRHPKETLELFDIQKGQVVLEVLPGGGWYSKILLPILGENGSLIGVDYSMDIWPNFPFTDEAFLNKRASWPQDWPTETSTWNITPSAKVEAYTFDTISEALTESVDRVLFIRALHNLARYEDKGQFMSNAVSETLRVLKPGGLVGVVQHQAPDTMSDEWADGSRGYLKQEFVTKLFEQAGLELVATSDVNNNPADQPGEEDIVWRLPPTYYTSKDNDELKAKFEKIGESNRMTLVFKKPDVVSTEK
ncbi:MAG: methyltransferase [Agarilytica sp.]